MHAIQSLLYNKNKRQQQQELQPSSLKLSSLSASRYKYQQLHDNQENFNAADESFAEDHQSSPKIATITRRRYSSSSSASTLLSLCKTKIATVIFRCYFLSQRQSYYALRIGILVLCIFSLYYVRAAFLSLNSSPSSIISSNSIERVVPKINTQNSEMAAAAVTTAAAAAASTMISMRRLLCTALVAAERGGREVRAVQESAQLHERSKGGVRNPVTDGDLRSHWAMYGVLRATFGPSLNIVSEEQEESNNQAAAERSHAAHDLGTYSAEVSEQELACANNVYKHLPETGDEDFSSSDIAVWIDPLDATQEYTENLLQYVTTMVGIAVKGKAVAGVVHKPFENQSYWAWEGRVASPSLKNHQNKVPSPTDDVRIIVSRSHAGKVAEFCRDALEGRGYEITPAGGAGYKGLMVALGEQDVYVHATKIKKWDLCAPNALINALGGRLTTLLGEDVDYADTRVDNEHEIVQDGFVAAVNEHQYFLDRFKNVKLLRR